MSHAKLSPSSAERWLACPGSIREIAGRESPPTRYSQEGDLAHEIAAECLQRSRDATVGIGRKHADNPDVIFTADMAEALQTYLDGARVRLILSGAVSGAVSNADGTGDVYAIGDPLVRVEQRSVAIPALVWGTADLVIHSERARTLDVIDLKFGRGTFVPVEDNVQTMIYAVGLLLEYPTVKTVRLHICQPRYAQAEAWREVTMTADALLDWVSRTLSPGVARTQDPAAPLVPGNHCQFCPARGECPELRERALETAQATFAPVPLNQRVAALSPAETADLLGKLPLIEEWIAAVRDHAHLQALAGNMPPGWKLVQRVGNRKWIDEASAASALQATGIDPYDKSVVSPAEAERRLKSAGLGKASLDAFTVRPATGTALVPASDKRPAVTPSANPFTPIEQSNNHV